MPIYEIEQYETHTATYRVKANSGAEAVAKLFEDSASNDCEPIDGSFVFVEINQDIGLSADEHRDLARELEALGHKCKDVIPSIRSISEVKE